MSGNARRDWIALRVSSIIAIPLTFWLVLNVTGLVGAPYEVFIAWLHYPLNAALMIVSILVFFYHAALGVHEIVEDYVHNEALKKAGLCLKKLAFIAVGAVCVLSVLKVALS